MPVRAVWLVGALVAGVAALGVATLRPARALSFTFGQIAGDSLTPMQSAAFAVAGAAWSTVLTDEVEVRLNIGFRDLGSNGSGALILGGASPIFVTAGYDAFKTELMGDATSVGDGMAVAALPGGVVNDAILMTSAQARAIGFTTAAGLDGTIEFSSNPGISFAATRAAMTSGTYDLIGVAAHEIGHLLGFVSSLDLGVATRSVLDLFRYAGLDSPGFTAGQAAHYSLDFGATSLGSFAVGGAGQSQASHWLGGTGRLLDPGVAAGVVKDITAGDALALDTVGFDVAVPEPASAALVLAGLGMLGVWRRREAG